MSKFQEHDHEAEQLISTLSLNPEDDELDVGRLYIDIYSIDKQICGFQYNNILLKKS